MIHAHCASSMSVCARLFSRSWIRELVWQAMVHSPSLSIKALTRCVRRPIRRISDDVVKASLHASTGVEHDMIAFHSAEAATSLLRYRQSCALVPDCLLFLPAAQLCLNGTVLSVEGQADSQAPKLTFFLASACCSIFFCERLRHCLQCRWLPKAEVFVHICSCRPHPFPLCLLQGWRVSKLLLLP